MNRWLARNGIWIALAAGFLSGEPVFWLLVCLLLPLTIIHDIRENRAASPASVEDQEPSENPWGAPSRPLSAYRIQPHPSLMGRLRERLLGEGHA